MLDLHHWSFNLLEGICLLCLEPAASKRDLCDICTEQLPWLTSGCCYCSLPLAPGQVICADCARKPPSYSAALCSFEYRFPINQLIHQFKEQQNLAAGRLLTTLSLNQLIPQLPAPSEEDVLLALPAHWRTRWRRGFNQTELIAQWLDGGYPK